MATIVDPDVILISDEADLEGVRFTRAGEVSPTDRTSVSSTRIPRTYDVVIPTAQERSLTGRTPPAP